MNDNAQAPGNPGAEGDHAAEHGAGPGEDSAATEAREAAMIQEVVRLQERHREGGIEPELADLPEDHEPDA